MQWYYSYRNNRKLKPSIGQQAEAGFSFMEILLAVAVGSIILLGVYSSYVIVSRQYTRLSTVAEVQDFGIPVLHLLMRDVRMAGYVAVDDSMQSNYGAITTPITLTDSGNACCDSLTVVYDKDTNTRERISYFVGTKTNPTRNVLYMNRDRWSGVTWINTVNQALVADYIDDLQFVGSNPDINGNPTLVDMSMIFQSKTRRLESSTYQKPAYNVGNYAYTANDAYYRDEFNATVKIRNLN